jgi:hypothetical protein
MGIKNRRSMHLPCKLGAAIRTTYGFSHIISNNTTPGIEIER